MQEYNQISSLDGAIFPAGLTWLKLVSLQWRILQKLAFFRMINRLHTLTLVPHVTRARDVQSGNRISSLDGAVFPAGLPWLMLVYAVLDCLVFGFKPD